MTILGFFGILIGLLAIPVLLRQATFTKLSIALALAMLHIAASFYYYLYTQTNLADAWAYYYSDSIWSGHKWASDLGTAFAGTLTQFLKHSLGATYLDCFMLFQAFGIWGILLMMKAFSEISEKALVPESQFATYILFIPSLHFWTSAIGKDSPIFFGVALSTWAVLNLSRRWLLFGAGVIVMMLFRPHIALAAGVALTVAALTYRQFSMGKKVILVLVAAVGTGYLLSAVQSTFAVDLTDPTSVSHFMDVKNAADLTDNARTSIAHAAFPLRLFALLFRPFFVDAKNAMGIVASIENVGSVLLFIFFARHFRSMLSMGRDILFVRFTLVFSLILIVILAILDYNVGLGLRQRVMAMPPVFALFVAAYSIAQRKLAAEGRVLARPAQAKPRAQPATSLSAPRSSPEASL